MPTNTCLFRFSLLLLLVFLLPGQPALAVFGEDGDTTSSDESVLTEIVIEGNTRTDTGLILRELDLTIGQTFNYEQMDAAWDHLEDLGHFAFVEMEYDDEEPGEVVLRIYLEEDYTFKYGPLLRYSQRHKYLLGASCEEANLRGRGETLFIGVAPIYPLFAEAAWERPWFLNVRGLSARLAVAAEQADFVFRPTEYRKWEAGLELEWQFRGPFFVDGGIKYIRFDQRDDFAWALPYRGEGSPAGTVLFEAGQLGLTALSIGVGVDTRSNPYYPRRGVYGRFSVVRWNSPDWTTYGQNELDARAFVPIPWHQHTLALRAYGRKVCSPAHLDNVLFWGGPKTVRGYRFGGMEGDEGYLLSVEYRIPLFLMPISPQGELIGFGVHLFADAGDAWYEGADPGRAAQSWGAGTHIHLDKLQLRFEAAQNQDGDWRFEFMDRFNF